MPDDEAMDQPDRMGDRPGAAIDWDNAFKALDAKGARPKGAEEQTPLQRAAAGEPPTPPAGGGGGEDPWPVVAVRWYGTGHEGTSAAGSASIEFYQMPPATTLIALATAVGQQLRAPQGNG